MRYTLEPLVYVGVSEGLPQDKWKLRSPQEILNLKICDPTMGSGAFLVQVCRYLAARLLESWEGLPPSPQVWGNKSIQSPPELGDLGGLDSLKQRQMSVFTVFGNVSKPDLDEALIPDDDLDRLIVAKRLIAERCVYGVDKNPLAVEMAKLSLWLETLQKDKPFTFVDHALRCGDSLVGVTVEQLRFWDLNVSSHIHQLGIGINEVWNRIREAIAKRMELESFTVNSREDRAKKEALLAESQARIKDLKDRADLLVMSYLASCKRSQQDDLRRELLLVANGEMDVSESQRELLPDLEALRPFHWELEFPEVFLSSTSQKTTGKGLKPLVPLVAQGGFDAICGNPPFMGGSKITGVMGTPYRDFLVDWIAQKKGNADFVAYFFLQACNLLKNDGCFGLVATNTIAQGDTREIGLDQVATKGKIYRAIPSRPWSGTAALEVAYVWAKKGDWEGKYLLDGKEVEGITPYLTVSNQTLGNPLKLEANSGKSFTGNKVYGEGFVLEIEEAQSLIIKNPKNKDVLFPYLNGEDLNTSPNQSPARWVINFFDWSLSHEHDDPKNPKGAPYASDYPDCLEIVEKLVKPYRDTVNNKKTREQWWIHERTRKELYDAISQCDRVLVKTQISRTWAWAFQKTGIIFDQRCVVFAVNSWRYFSILQSEIHWEWSMQFASTLKQDMSYTPSTCFETFPFPFPTPETEKELEAIGEKYYNQRQQIMQTTQLGLTKTYNRFHDPNDIAIDIQQLRELHIQMDYAVMKAYGWVEQLRITNYELGGEQFPLAHGFHQTKQGLRFTISETARRDILDRLLALNHQRYAEEVKAGVGKEKGKRKKEKVVDKRQTVLDV
ncbi:hypothetical protein H6F41_18525 [Pseudanabaena sp. FACHB-723]|uniref:site-specific DNA-methyltransferase (adenine-specific) n=1 Tax=Pseudanabaena mucicola FACHB-723 TaxID=2692860 RepID=A0ABR8A421_9CYAN|nr:hypothetical protein [Pseudanabaena mucicola FACHB-723]